MKGASTHVQFLHYLYISLYNEEFPLFRSSVGTDYSVCHLAELDDNRLNFYGSGSLEAVDRNWGEKAASSVTYVSFHFINFDQIVPYLAKIKSRFVNITVSWNKYFLTENLKGIFLLFILKLNSKEEVELILNRYHQFSFVW